MMVQHIFALSFFGCLIISASTCHLGYNIIGVQTAKDGQYDLSCSQRALSICPKVCSWTNQTCEEYATRRHWNKTHLIVTNMTYSYPLKASGYPRNDVGSGSVKSLHRRCCLAENIEATKCKSVVWNADQSKSKFDVLASAESSLKCAPNNAYIRDIQQRTGIQRTFNMDICCLKYPKDHDARVACQAPKNGETQAGVDAAAKIALGVSLPLALGIGIPLYLLSCEARAQILEGATGDCANAMVLTEVSRKECCNLCTAKNFDACVFVPAALAQIDLCITCYGFSNLDPGAFPGQTLFIPK